jgi:hypothetical protein
MHIIDAQMVTTTLTHDGPSAHDSFHEEVGAEKGKLTRERERERNRTETAEARRRVIQNIYMAVRSIVIMILPMIARDHGGMNAVRAQMARSHVVSPSADDEALAEHIAGAVARLYVLPQTRNLVAVVGPEDGLDSVMLIQITAQALAEATREYVAGLMVSPDNTSGTGSGKGGHSPDATHITSEVA